MRILTLAIKDLKLLLRDRMGAFFVLGFPILMGVFFGLVMGGPSSGDRGKMQVAIVDQDQSPISQKFVSELRDNENIELVTDSLEPAMESVRLGKRMGVIVLPKDFGQAAGLIWQTQPEIQVGLDPSRTAESAMLEGFIMQANASLIGERFRNPRDFLPSITSAREQVRLSDANPQTKVLSEALFGSLEKMVESADALQADDREREPLGDQGIQFANIKSLDVARKIDPNSVEAQVKKIRSRWDISFPQAMLWGVLGCVAGFSISIARERSMGTLLRLQVSPLSIMQILVGKALACFLAVLLVMVVMVILGLFLEMRPISFPKLAVAALATAVCFVGIMMTLAVLGKTEQSVAGIGWAVNMVMAMFGGCMVPAMFLPGFMQRLSFISPIRWSILVLEGAIWRDFSWREMVLPLIVLGAIGAAGVALGTSILRRRIN
jgi:ABC-2 type transport system permease protein